MVKALFDTNVLIDFLHNVAPARDVIDGYEAGAISVVTWIEVMIGVERDLEAGTRDFLNSFEFVGLEPPVAEEAVLLRRTHRIKLPDAIIWASARRTGRLLVTRNTRDFPADDPGVRHPYVL
ncbi:MAG TPA: type II toxin-antitoxin system VapC family toxin [Caulobacteraceae bacterium]|nr:type II toxin-antitoxin system VapC family toxin [Caulobacteraceae bacterium]